MAPCRRLMGGGGFLGGQRHSWGRRIKVLPSDFWWVGGGGDLVLDGFKRVPLAPALQFPLDVPQRVADEIQHI